MPSAGAAGWWKSAPFLTLTPLLLDGLELAGAGVVGDDAANGAIGGGGGTVDDARGDVQGVARLESYPVVAHAVSAGAEST